MKKALITVLVALLVLSGMPADSHAGPWTLKKGKFWTEVFTRYFFAKESFDAEARRSRWPDGGYSEIWDLEVKFEYGVTDDFNLLLGIPYSWSRWKNDWSKTVWGQQEKHEGFKEITPGFKYRITKKPVVTAFQAKAYIHPQGTDQNVQPDLFEYGDGLEVRGLIGKAWTIKKRPCYASFETGYFWSSDWINKSDYANYIPIFGELGFSPFDWLMLKGEVDFRYSHQGTGVRKDTLTWRAGPIISLMGRGFSSIKKGGESSLNVEFQYGQTVWGRGDGSSERYNRISAAQEFVMKVQVLW